MRRFQPANSASTAVDESSEAGWILPYVDQPIVFWERLHSEIGTHIREIYFPLPGGVIGSGRPPQPDSQLQAFLKDSSLPRSVLLNPVILERPVDDMAPAIIEALRRLIGEFGIRSATVSSLLLAARIRESLPDLPLTASILMDIAYPNQILMLKGLCETVVPSGRIFRDLRALKALRTAFSGRIRLIVNEACLPACPYRIQHFYEMNAFSGPSRSLCTELLEKMPWMRLTGTWVLPQHLHLFEGLCDEWKLAGRVTLRDAANYLRVARAYIYRLPLAPSEIGGGPASVLEPIDITEDFFKSTLSCGRNCHECRICREYDAVMRDEPAAAWRNPEKGVENARRESLVVI